MHLYLPVDLSRSFCMTWTVLYIRGLFCLSQSVIGLYIYLLELQLQYHSITTTISRVEGEEISVNIVYFRSCKSECIN